MGIYDPTTQFPGDAQYAINGWLGGWRAQPIVKPIDPWWRPGDLTFVQPGAKLVSRTSIPIHAPGLQPWKGAFEFGQTSGLFMKVERAMFQKGTKANLFSMAEFDPGAFDMAPETMAVEIGNNPGLALVAILNGCYSGTAQDAAGNVLPAQLKISATDQIYGGNLAVLSTDTKKLVNPGDPSFLSAEAWYNAHQNFAIDVPNIVTVLQNQQQRRAMNGIELGLGDEGLELWVPYASKESARILVEVMRELAGSGIVSPDLTTYQVDTGGANTTNQQIIFGSQTNPVYGRMKVRAIHGMRSDLWCIVSPRPKPSPEFSAFLYAHGGQVGEYAIQTNPAALMADTVPHIAVYQWTQQSPMFFGVPGTQAGDIGISMLVNEGFAAASGLLFDYCFTGAAS